MNTILKFIQIEKTHQTFQALYSIIKFQKMSKMLSCWKILFFNTKKLRKINYSTLK